MSKDKSSQKKKRKRKLTPREKDQLDGFIDNSGRLTELGKQKYAKDIVSQYRDNVYGMLTELGKSVQLEMEMENKSVSSQSVQPKKSKKLKKSTPSQSRKSKTSVNFREMINYMDQKLALVEEWLPNEINPSFGQHQALIKEAKAHDAQISSELLYWDTSQKDYTVAGKQWYDKQIEIYNKKPQKVNPKVGAAIMTQEQKMKKYQTRLMNNAKKHDEEVSAGPYLTIDPVKDITIWSHHGVEWRNKTLEQNVHKLFGSNPKPKTQPKPRTQKAEKNELYIQKWKNWGDEYKKFFTAVMWKRIVTGKWHESVDQPVVVAKDKPEKSNHHCPTFKSPSIWNNGKLFYTPMDGDFLKQHIPFITRNHPTIFLPYSLRSLMAALILAYFSDKTDIKGVWDHSWLHISQSEQLMLCIEAYQISMTYRDILSKEFAYVAFSKLSSPQILSISKYQRLITNLCQSPVDHSLLIDSKRFLQAFDVLNTMHLLGKDTLENIDERHCYTIKYDKRRYWLTKENVGLLMELHGLQCKEVTKMDKEGVTQMVANWTKLDEDWFYSCQKFLEYHYFVDRGSYEKPIHKLYALPNYSSAVLLCKDPVVYQRRLSQMYSSKYPINVAKEIKPRCIEPTEKQYLLEGDQVQHLMEDMCGPSSVEKGKTIVHSVGSGKTCLAIRVGAKFLYHGYKLIWVTKTSLKESMKKNLHTQICHDPYYRDYLQSKLSNTDSEIAIKMLQGLPLQKSPWEILSYRDFSNLLIENEFNNNNTEELLDVVSKHKVKKRDYLYKTFVVFDEMHIELSTQDNSNDIGWNEIGDMNVIYRNFKHSYRISKQKSVKSLILTATPMYYSVLSLFYMCNLQQIRDPLPMMTCFSVERHKELLKDTDKRKDDPSYVAVQEEWKRVKAMNKKTERELIKLLYPSSTDPNDIQVLPIDQIIASYKENHNNNNKNDDDDDLDEDNIRFMTRVSSWARANGMMSIQQYLDTNDITSVNKFPSKKIVNSVRDFWPKVYGLLSIYNVTADPTRFARVEWRPLIVVSATTLQENEIARVLFNKTTRLQSKIKRIMSISSWATYRNSIEKQYDYICRICEEEVTYNEKVSQFVANQQIVTEYLQLLRDDEAWVTNLLSNITPEEKNSDEEPKSKAKKRRRNPEQILLEENNEYQISSSTRSHDILNDRDKISQILFHIQKRIRVTQQNLDKLQSSNYNPFKINVKEVEAVLNRQNGRASRKGKKHKDDAPNHKYADDEKEEEEVKKQKTSVFHFERDSFNKTLFSKYIPFCSPKCTKLPGIVQQCKGKVIIYCHDLGSIRAVAGTLMTEMGYELGMRCKDNKWELRSNLVTKAKNRFLILSKSSLNGVTIDRELKTSISTMHQEHATFNHHENYKGDYIKIVIIDRNYKEGVDLPANDIILFDEVTSQHQLTQIVGRANRYCGLSMKLFEENVGWVLNVHRLGIRFHQNRLRPELSIEHLFSSSKHNDNDDDINTMSTLTIPNPDSLQQHQEDFVELFQTKLETDLFSPVELCILLQGNLHTQRLMKEVTDGYLELTKRVNIGAGVYKRMIRALEKQDNKLLKIQAEEMITKDVIRDYLTKQLNNPLKEGQQNTRYTRSVQNTLRRLGQYLVEDDAMKDTMVEVISQNSKGLSYFYLIPDSELMAKLFTNVCNLCKTDVNFFSILDDELKQIFDEAVQQVFILKYKEVNKNTWKELYKNIIPKRGKKLENYDQLLQLITMRREQFRKDIIAQGVDPDLLPDQVYPEYGVGSVNFNKDWWPKIREYLQTHNPEQYDQEVKRIFVRSTHQKFMYDQIIDFINKPS